MEIDILTGSILIGLFLTNVILIFLDSRQQSRFRQTETRLRDALLEQQSTFRQTETRLRDTLLEKIEEVEHLLRQYHTSTLFDYQAPWWKDYSWLYRHVRDWQCEECQLSLNSDRQYLHTHHIYGTQHNNPNDLKALCIAYHSEQLGTNHEKLKSLKDYREFKEKYGERWRLLKDSPPLASNQ